MTHAKKRIYFKRAQLVALDVITIREFTNHNASFTVGTELEIWDTEFGFICPARVTNLLLGKICDIPEDIIVKVSTVNGKCKHAQDLIEHLARTYQRKISPRDKVVAMKVKLDPEEFAKYEENAANRSRYVKSAGSENN